MFIGHVLKHFLKCLFKFWPIFLLIKLTFSELKGTSVVILTHLLQVWVLPVCLSLFSFKLTNFIFIYIDF